MQCHNVHRDFHSFLRLNKTSCLHLACIPRSFQQLTNRSPEEKFLAPSVLEDILIVFLSEQGFLLQFVTMQHGRKGDSGHSVEQLFDVFLWDRNLKGCHTCMFIEDKVSSTHYFGVIHKVISIPRKCNNVWSQAS